MKIGFVCGLMLLYMYLLSNVVVIEVYVEVLVVVNNLLIVYIEVISLICVVFVDWKEC